MARLKVLRNQNFFDEKDIVPGEVFVVGRGDGCQIKLEADPGISRKHFSIEFLDNEWRFVMLSRFGELFQKGAKVESLDLRSKEVEFAIPPYSFFFSMHDQLDVKNSNESEDQTAVVALASEACLQLFSSPGNIGSPEAVARVFKLQGDHWVAGRDMTCQVFLDNSQISRKQFEISKKNGAFFIKDSGSANGTLLNGEKLSQSEWTPLQSSDLISVVDVVLQFEIRDLGFDQRLDEVKPDLRNNVQVVVTKEGAPLELPVPLVAAAPSSEPVPPSSLIVNPQPQISLSGPQLKRRRKPKKKSNAKLMLYGFIGIAMIVGVVLKESTNQPKPVEKPALNLSAFDKLPLEQQTAVKQLYNNATQLFYQQKYQLALQELQRVHQLISVYEDSKNLEAAAGQAIIAEQEKLRIERIEKERELIEVKINRQVAECRTKMNANSNLQEIDRCLAPVLEFNPQHPAIVQLKSDVDRITSDRLAREAQRRDYNAAVQQLEAIFQSALKKSQSEDYRDGIAALQKVVNQSGPDPRMRKDEARQLIANIRSKVRKQQENALNQADEYYKEGKLRDAVKALEIVLKIDPSAEEISDRVKSYTNELRKQMQVIYQEAVLEESVGEVEAAKAKWKKILESSLPSEEYYQKAKIKLKKYGIF